MNVIESIEQDWQEIQDKIDKITVQKKIEKGCLDKELLSLVIKVLENALYHYEDKDFYFKIMKYVIGFEYQFFYGPDGDNENFLKYSRLNFRKLHEIPSKYQCPREELINILNHFKGQNQHASK